MAVQAIRTTTFGFNDEGSTGGGGGYNSTFGNGGGNSTSITLPVNTINYPTTPVNTSGLSTLLNPNSYLLTEDSPADSIIKDLINSEPSTETINISSQAIDLVINVVSDVYVNTPDIREITYPKEVRGADFVGYDVDFDISWNSVHATIIRMYVGNSTDYVELGPKGNLTLNVKELLDKYPLQSHTKPSSKPSQKRGGLPPNVSMDKAPNTLDARIDGRPDQRREQTDNGQREERRQAPPPLPSIDRAQRNAL